MKHMNAVVTVGISASGKSTYAKELVEVYKYTEVNRDNIRRAMFAKNHPNTPFHWSKWNWKLEKKVTDEQIDQISAAYEAESDIVISDTNLSAKTRKLIVDRLTAHGYKVEIKEFEVTLEEAWKRDSHRECGVGHSVIATQYQQWLEYKGQPQKYVPLPEKPNCILVDIDGTLAHMNGKRGAFEWKNVGLDDVDKHVRELVNCWSDKGGASEVIVMSGRDEVCRPETEKWLKDNFVQYDHLFMRVANDMRKDTFVKEELFNRYVRENYNVQFVIDDRPSVARMWRDVLGLKVFQVGNPHIEF